MIDTAGHITIDKIVDELLKMPPRRRETAARSWVAGRGAEKAKQVASILARVREREFQMITPTQFDTTPITAQITRLIATGGTEQAILAAVAHMFPEFSPAELSAALQDATAQAERRVVRKH